MVLGGFLGAIALGIGVKEILARTLKFETTGFGELLASYGTHSILVGDLAILALQTAVLFWRFERFPVGIWGILGVLKLICLYGMGSVVIGLSMPLLQESAQDYLRVGFIGGVVAVVSTLLVTVLEAYFLATIFKKAQAWLWIGAGLVIFQVVLLGMAYAKVALPNSIPQYVFPLFSAGAMGYWLATAELVEQD